MAKGASKLHVKKGDLVQVMKGENAGRSGKILTVDTNKKRVVVDGLNIVKKHTRPTQTNPQGGIIERPGSIHVANVMLVCPNCNQPTKTGKEIVKNETVRACKKCGKAID